MTIQGTSLVGKCEQNESFSLLKSTPCIHDTFTSLHKQFLPYARLGGGWVSLVVCFLLKIINLRHQKNLLSGADGSCIAWAGEGLFRLYASCRGGLPFYNSYSVSLYPSVTNRVGMNASISLSAKAAALIFRLNFVVDNNEMYSKCFRGYRRAAKECDELVFEDISQDVAIIWKGGLYSVDASITVNINVLEMAIRGITSNISIRDAEMTIGMCSSIDRESWLRMEKTEACNDRFNSALNLLRRAKFVVCIDDSDRTGYSNSVNNEEYENNDLKFSNLHNRFYDKLIQFVVSKESDTYAIFEHAGIDGITAVEICESVSRVDSPPIFGVERHSNKNCDLIRHEYSVGLDISDKGMISQYILNQIESFDCKRTILKGFDTAYFSKCFYPSDSMVQIALQFAYYRCSKKLPTVYEPVSMGHIGGRLDFISTLSSASKKLILNFGDAFSPLHLRDAVKFHRKSLRKSKSGKGDVLHLMALSAIEFDRDPKKWAVVSRLRKKILSKISRMSKFLVHRDMTASNGGKSNVIKSFSTICHDPNMLGVGYIINDFGLSLDLQIHGETKECIDKSVFIENLSYALKQLADMPAYTVIVRGAV